MVDNQKKDVPRGLRVMSIIYFIFALLLVYNTIYFFSLSTLLFPFIILLFGLNLWKGKLWSKIVALVIAIMFVFMVLINIYIGENLDTFIIIAFLINLIIAVYLFYHLWMKYESSITSLKLISYYYFIISGFLIGSVIGLDFELNYSNLWDLSLVASAIINVIIGTGILNVRNWARILAMIFAIINIFAVFIFYLSSPISIISGVISLIILYYLMFNEKVKVAFR